MGVRGFDEGLAIRRAVLGDEYVDGALASADDFSRPFQRPGAGWIFQFNLAPGF